MLIGRLDKKITIYKRNFNLDDFGGVKVRGTTSTVTAWARIDFDAGSTSMDADAFTNNQPVRMTIRWTSTIGTSPQYYINSAEYGDYFIRSVQELGRREGLVLICDNKNTTGVKSL